MRIFGKVGVEDGAIDGFSSNRPIGTDSLLGLNSTSDSFSRHVCTSVST